MRLCLARLRGLYGMVDVGPGGPAAAAARLAQLLLDGGARVLQVRMKGAGAGEMLAVVDALRPLCDAGAATLIVNDRLDVALAGRADGVHLGQDDLPLSEARRLAPQMIIGVSTHNLEQARAAAVGGADYIGFGPVFATSTKERADPVVGVAELTQACRLALPVVAIGGITLARVAEVAAAGAAAAAMIAAVNGADDPVAAARAVTSAFA